ncbi:flagellar motor switch protein [Actibacterium sp. MT2.3-13A]|uniref:flagellar motor switch protein n=1 Tax=Actibacterium sp. MT2.3-13A TaxID=2828332 RepID=UPI001BAA23E9|nr:flagellar motor switch protein [Actibacterium sp. MT2.3-13A]
MALLIDTLILLLLAGTLGYAFMVERRVRTLMAALKELQPVVGELSNAVDRSESSVVALKSVAEKVAADAPRPAAPQPEAAGGGSTLTFRSVRAPRRVAGAGVTSLGGKSDLVRSFFEAARSRGA